MISLILGAEGMVGHALARKIPNAVLGTHDDMDITDYEVMFKVFSKHRPDIVYLPAGITNVDKCEDPSTDRANIHGAIQVARLCDMFGTKLIYFSSAYVFSGISMVPYTEHDITNPAQRYGHQKVIVERMLIESNINCVIIRTVGVFGEGPKNKNYVKQVIKSIRRGEKFISPTDQMMNPISVTDLATISIVLGMARSGVFHVAGDTCMTKYEFARMVAAYFGKEKSIEGVTSRKLDQAAVRPHNACLDCSKLVNAGMPVPSFQEGLHRYLSAEYGSRTTKRTHTEI